MPLPPIVTAHLFPQLDARLVELLRSLDGGAWELPTVAPGWRVKDVAAHLLDTQQRKLAVARGEPSPAAPPIASHGDLVALIDRLNRDGVSRYRRLAPNELIARLDSGAAEFARYVQSLDPFADARFAVSWAGEERSPNWFDTARELTERWHHQQQIRRAVGRPGIMTPELYHPVLDCFMRALPYVYRDITREPGTLARFTVSGDCGGSWFLRREAGGWPLVDAPDGAAASETTIPQEIAWLIFTKGMRRDEAIAGVRVAGDAALGLHVLGMITIVG